MPGSAEERWQLAQQLLHAARLGAAEVLARRDRGEIAVEVKQYAAAGRTPVDFVTDADNAA
ncbi:MAG: hypothetical protein GEV07_04820 [Streptosporangiales bacterium]|nr:hypothetical protein [Streptosporangiales bacterium]